MNWSRAGVILECLRKVTTALLFAVGVFAGGVETTPHQLRAVEQRAVPDKQEPKQVSGEKTRAKGNMEKPGSSDLYGDPLPPGALARMGTVQFRHLPGGVGTAFSPDGNVLATTDGNALRTWSMASGKLLLQVKEDHEWWGPVMFSPDGKWLASACNGSLHLLNAATGKLVRQIPAVERVLAFSPDSELVATSAHDPKEPASVFLWQTTTGQQVFQLRGREQSLYSAVFTPDGRTLVTLSPSQQQPFDKIICHWDVATGTLRKTVALHLPPIRRSLSLCLSPDGQTVAFALYSSTEAVSLWDTHTGKKKATLQGDLSAAQHLAFTPDSRILATSWVESDASEGTISLWDAATGKRLRRFSVPSQAAYGLQFAPDGRTLTTKSGGPRVYLWDTATGQPLWQRAAHDGQIWSLAFTPDCGTLVSASADGSIRVWATANGQQERELVGHRWHVSTAAIMPDGQAVLSGGGDGFLRLQELHSGKQLRRFLIDREPEKLTKPGDQISWLVVVPDGRTAAAVSGRTDRPGPLLHVWDLATGRSLVRRSLPEDEHFISFPADAKRMVGYLSPQQTEKKDNGSAEESSGSTLAVLREVATGRQLVAIPQPDSPCFQRAFSPDGQTLATLTSRSLRQGDGYRVDRHAIHLWELATGKERLTITNDENGEQFAYEQIAFTPDGRSLATARKDHTLQLWDVATGQELLRRTGYEADVNTLAFTPNGRALATGHTDSTILLWRLTPEIQQRLSNSHLLTRQELETAWIQLANPDTRKAHATIWQLSAVARQAVPLLRDRLHPAKTVAAEWLQQLMKDLDSSQFRQRDAAAKQLSDLEEQAERALTDALKGNPSVEQRRRIEALLARPRVVSSPEKLRSLRAIQVLEQSDLPEARQVLEALAQGAPEARLTQEANAALERLTKRIHLSR